MDKIQKKLKIGNILKHKTQLVAIGAIGLSSFITIGVSSIPNEVKVEELDEKMLSFSPDSNNFAMENVVSKTSKTNIGDYTNNWNNTGDKNETTYIEEKFVPLEKEEGIFVIEKEYSLEQDVLDREYYNYDDMYFTTFDGMAEKLGYFKADSGYINNNNNFIPTDDISNYFKKNEVEEVVDLTQTEVFIDDKRYKYYDNLPNGALSSPGIFEINEERDSAGSKSNFAINETLFKLSLPNGKVQTLFNTISDFGESSFVSQTKEIKTNFKRVLINGQEAKYFLWNDNENPDYIPAIIPKRNVYATNNKIISGDVNGAYKFGSSWYTSFNEVPHSVLTNYVPYTRYIPIQTSSHTTIVGYETKYKPAERYQVHAPESYQSPVYKTSYSSTPAYYEYSFDKSNWVSDLSNMEYSFRNFKEARLPKGSISLNGEQVTYYEINSKNHPEYKPVIFGKTGWYTNHDGEHINSNTFYTFDYSNETNVYFTSQKEIDSFIENRLTKIHTQQIDGEFNAMVDGREHIFNYYDEYLGKKIITPGFFHIAPTDVNDQPVEIGVKYFLYKGQYYSNTDMMMEKLGYVPTTIDGYIKDNIFYVEIDEDYSFGNLTNDLEIAEIYIDKEKIEFETTLVKKFI